MKKQDTRNYAQALLLACEGKKKGDVDKLIKAVVLHWGVRGKLKFLTSVLELAQRINEEKNGVKRVNVTLTQCEEKEVRVLTSSLTKMLGSDAEITITQDESLLAGGVITMGDIRIDGSLRTRINQFAKHLQGTS